MTTEKIPKISVLIPVYNSADHLRICMDSLLNQSFEDYEIIAVNNGSDDDSLKILQNYQNDYPDKVFVYTIEHSNFVGTGRNYALRKARGEYIYICDSDDIVEKHALTWLYARAVQYKADVVYGYFNFVNLQSNTVMIMGRDGEKSVTPGELILTGADYWRRLYKKTLLDEVIEKVGPIPENTNFDDVAWLPVVHSYAKCIRSADRLIYNYFRRTSSTVGGYSSKIVEYSIFSENYAMKNCNPQYREYAELYAAKRVNNNLLSRWRYSDMLIEHIKNNWPAFSNNTLIKSDNKLFNNLAAYASLPDQPCPKIVYINGFGNNITDEYILQIKEKAFDECECVILNEENCNIKTNSFTQQAYANRDFDELAGYFALEKIYENGGIYVSRNIDIDNPFNSLRYFPAFFAYKNVTEFSGEVFGGMAGNEVFKAILKTYIKVDYSNREYSLSKRITNIICVRYGVKLNGATEFFKYPFATLAPSVMVADIFYGEDNAVNYHICSHKYTGSHINRSDIAIVDKSSIAALASRNKPQSSTPIVKEKIPGDYEFYKNRVKMIEESKAYKLALTFSKLGNIKLFSLLKKIIKKLIK